MTAPPQATPATPFGLESFVAAFAETQAAAGEAHDLFLRIQAGLTQTAAAALAIQTELFRRMLAHPGAVVVPAASPTDPPRSLDTEQCFTFARGRVGEAGEGGEQERGSHGATMHMGSRRAGPDRAATGTSKEMRASNVRSHGSLTCRLRGSLTWTATSVGAGAAGM